MTLFDRAAGRAGLTETGAAPLPEMRQPGRFGVIAPMLDLSDGLSRIVPPPLPMVWVAAPGHPLAQCAPDAQAQTLRDAVQIVLSDRSAATAGRDYAVLSARTWRCDGLALKHALIRAGAGWGPLPLRQVAGDIAAGRLRHLSGGALAATDAMPVPAFHDAGHQPGPAMSPLIDALRFRPRPSAPRPRPANAPYLTQRIPEAPMGILNTLLRAVTWWNGQTLNTQFWTWRKGQKVGEDAQGNVFYQTADGKRRWVIFNGEAEASRVSPEWHGWLHYTWDEPPTKAPLPKKPWEKPHLPNLTGTPAAYVPPGSIRRPEPAPRRDYEAWTPD